MICFKRLLEFATPLILVSIVAGCGSGKQAPPPPPPAAVTVSKPVQREVIQWDDFTGHLESPESVIVSARVSGLVESVPFVEGSIVKKGQLLFTIDVRPFQADLDAQIANAAKAKAQVDIAQSNFDREDLALKGNAVSQQDYDNAKATLEQNKAQLGAAQAATEASRLNVEFCRVTSPIDGRVSNKMVTRGNLVNGGAGQATELTTIQSIDPMYCYVDVDENSVLKYQKLSAEKKRANARDSKVPCFLELANETGFPREGYIDFIDNHVDPTTGTERVRGVFANPAGMLIPGFFATMRIPGSGRYQTLLVPDKAIGTDQDRRYVLVVGADNLVQQKVVQLGALFGPLRSIVSGIGPDDLVIIDGTMHARPGAPVAPTDAAIKVNDIDFAAGKPASTQDVPTSQQSDSDSSNPTSDSTTPSTTQPATNAATSAATGSAQ